MFLITFKCYADDLAVKNATKKRSLGTSKRCSTSLGASIKDEVAQMRVQSHLCKILTFVVRHGELKWTPKKAILNFCYKNSSRIHQATWTLRMYMEVVSNLSERCRPFSRLMKKGVAFELDEQWSKWYKSYLKNSQFGLPNKRATSYIVCCVSRLSFRALLEQKALKNKENTLYSVTWTFADLEGRYSLIERVCLVIIFTIQKLFFTLNII